MSRVVWCVYWIKMGWWMDGVVFVWGAWGGVCFLAGGWFTMLVGLIDVRWRKDGRRGCGGIRVKKERGRGIFMLVAVGLLLRGEGGGRAEDF